MNSSNEKKIIEVERWTVRNDPENLWHAQCFQFDFYFFGSTDTWDSTGRRDEWDRKKTAFYDALEVWEGRSLVRIVDYDIIRHEFS